jgi:hypothetical protein
MDQTRELQLILHRVARMLRQRDGAGHELEMDLERAIDISMGLPSSGEITLQDELRAKPDPVGPRQDVAAPLDPEAAAETDQDIDELFDDPETGETSEMPLEVGGAASGMDPSDELGEDMEQALDAMSRLMDEAGREPEADDEDDQGDPSGGVREPRRPLDPDQSGGVALDEPTT